MVNPGIPSLNPFPAPLKRVVLVAALLLLVLAGPAPPPVAASPLLLEQPQEYSLAGHLEMLSDPEGRLSLAEVLQPETAARFKPVPGFITRSYTRQTVWARFSLSRTPGFPDEGYLRLWPPYLDYLTAYVQSGKDPADPDSYREYRLGDHLPVAARPVLHSQFIIPIPLRSLPEVTVYVRMRSTSILNLFGAIHPPDQIITSAHRNTIFNGGYLGITLAIGLIHLIYFLRSRDPVFGYFAMFVFSTFSYFLGISGTISLVWPPMAHILSDYLVGAGIGASMTFIALFASRLLKTGSEYPYVHRYLQYVILFGIVLPLSVAPGWYGYVGPFIAINSLVLIVVLTGLSIALVRKDEPGGKLYLLAFSASNIGYAITFLRVLNLLPPAWNIDPATTLHLASLFNMLFMSLALTVRLHAAEVQAAAAARDAEHKAVELARKMTVELRQKQRELKIALRTEQQALKRQARFVEMISHEYRTPLAIIRANLDILQVRDSRVDGALSPYLEKMKRAIFRLVEVMEISLVRRRLDDTQAKAQFEVIPLVPFMRRLLEESRGTWQERHLEANLQDSDRSISGDAPLLKTAILNLVDNACKYSPAGSPVAISLAMEGGQAIITVRDHGQGMQPADLERAFEKYYRGKSSAGSSGAGIGLYLVRRIIEQHHGSVRLARAEKGGIMAMVTLPLLEKEENVDEHERADHPGRG